MHAIPEMMPVDEVLSRMMDTLQRLGQGPVVLTQNDRAAAVLVSPETWNALLAELEDLRDALDALNAYENYQQAPEAVKPWSEIRAGLVAEGRLDE